jgi:hypothetical protein
MKNRIAHCIFLLLFTGVIGCTSGNKKANTISTKEETGKHFTDSLRSDTTILVATLNKEDTAANEYLADVLKPIRANFKRLNSITNWDSANKKELWESLEGGEATYFYKKGILEKIITRNYGETYQQLTEYYLLNKQLSFVFARMYKYNRPLFYDSAAMKESNDDQVFDLNKSVITEDRSYFKNGKLLHQINNEDCGSPFTKAYLLDEQKRLQLGFEKLKTIAEKN